MQPIIDGKVRYRPRVEILGTERRTIVSKINNEIYDLYVNFPRSYWNYKIDQKYPVLYVLNAQWDFPLMISAYGNQNYDGAIPEIIIVGITWSGGEYKELDFDSLGKRDFLPRGNKNESLGEADNFLAVIEKEIIPFVETEYPLTSDRCLSAGSLAASFAIYTLLKKPALFNKFILSSPAIGKMVNPLSRVLKSTSAQRLKAKVYVTWGELENGKRQIIEFITDIKKVGGRNLKIQKCEIKATGHAGNKPISFTNGLFFCYGKSPLKLSVERIFNYTGLYKSDLETLELKIEKGKFIAHYLGNLFELKAEGEGKFFVSGIYLFLTFSKTQIGEIIAEVNSWNGSILFKKESIIN